MLLYVVRRLLAGLGVVVVVAILAYGGWRLLRNDLPQNSGPWLAGTWGDLERVLWHREYGVACSFASPQGSGCKSIVALFNQGWQADLWMLAGTVAVGTFAGMAGGLWCATNPSTWRARMLEAAAMAGLCAPPLVFGYGLLLLFDPTFGRFQVPLFFEVHVYRAPYEDPWNFFRAMLVPWIVAGAPVAAVVLRLTRSAVVEGSEEDFMRTAIAKGLSAKRTIYRHGRPLAYPTVFAWMSTASALIVTNVLITETVFSIPGFLRHTRRALKPPYRPETPDIPLLKGLAIWGAVLVVVLAIVADLLVMSKDPRVRPRGRIR